MNKMQELIGKRIFSVSLAAFLTVLAGCGGASDTAGEKTKDSVIEEPSPVQEEDASAKGETAPAQGEVMSEKDGRYTWQEITITLPEEWEGRYVIIENEQGFSICQKASYEKDDNMGYICGFFRTKEPEESGMGETLIAYGEDGMLYYLNQPTDVPCDTEDQELLGEYIRMCQLVPQVKASLQIGDSGIHYYAEEYVFPTSSILPLKKETLEFMSDNDLWIARNEIYARHGRQFDNEYLQRYFERCSWYEGSIPAKEFQESVLNQTEKDNLQLLVSAEQEYHAKHPYPKKYQAEETAEEDLSDSGTKDKISYQVVEEDSGGYQCRITVNGETYIANDIVYSDSEEVMTNPVMDCFYITDVLEGDGSLEIAVLDEGMSEDPVTYFFQYNGELFYIGRVLGFPFAEMNGGCNGFDGAGGITGRQRMDLIETAWLEGFWWYRGSRIVYQDLGWYEFLPDLGHTLYEDLTVHTLMEESSAVTVIPAQEKVYFLGSDMEQWILVKGKDGTEGYMMVQDGMITEMNKPAGEVFSDLIFSD